MPGRRRGIGHGVASSGKICALIRLPSIAHHTILEYRIRVFRSTVSGAFCSHLPRSDLQAEGVVLDRMAWMRPTLYDALFASRPVVTYQNSASLSGAADDEVPPATKAADDRPPHGGEAQGDIPRPGRTSGHGLRDRAVANSDCRSIQYQRR